MLYLRLVKKIKPATKLKISSPKLTALTIAGTLAIIKINKMRVFLSLLILSITFGFLTGCNVLIGEEVARLPINQVSRHTELIIKEATLDLKKGEEISFWTETDIEFEDGLALVYTVEVWKGSLQIGGFEMDALETNPTMMEVRTSFGNKTSLSYTGKMNSAPIEEDGKYTFRAVLNSSDNPTLKINKAELILKK